MASAASASPRPSRLLPLVPHRVQILLAFAVVYLVWGSTFLAIRVSVETLPPYVMATARLVPSGLLLLGWGWLRGGRWRWSQWPLACLTGLLLFTLGQAQLFFAETRLTSGIAALILTTIPLWMVVLEGCLPHGIHLSGRIWLGLALGAAGVVLLSGPSHWLGGQPVDRKAALVLIGAGLAWAIGSLLSSRAALPDSSLLTAGMTMLSGGIFTGLFAIPELPRTHWHDVHGTALAALLYLIVFGSVLGFSCYGWLLRNSTPARVATYAYVNPVVAVLLGALLLHEPVTPRTLIAGSIVVAAVMLILQARQKGASLPAPAAAAAGGAGVPAGNVK